MTSLSASRPRIAAWRDRLRRELDANVLPFWMKHSLDREHGGFLTCLDRDGRVYDTRKYVWLLARQVWTFSTLARERPEHLERDAWLAAARSGTEFLRAHAVRSDGRVWFALTRDGRGVKLQRKIFSECFLALALAAYGRAAERPELQTQAEELLDRILTWARDPVALGREPAPGAPPASELAVPMILLNVIGEVCAPGGRADERRRCADEIARHVQPDGVVLETVATDGARLDGARGRLINPGHALEAAWFLLEHAERTGDGAYVATALAMIDGSLARGWDVEHGGLYSFLDAEGYSPVELEWSLKLWWPHCEALLATAWALRTTGDTRWLEPFERVLDWTLARFPDGEHGEWFGYLDREGRVSQRFKGGPYKGCFHVPRALWRCSGLLDEVLGAAPS